MPDPGQNEQSLELPEVSVSPPLTVARGPAPPALRGPRRLAHRGSARDRPGGRPLRRAAPPRVLHRRDLKPQYPPRLLDRGRPFLPVVRDPQPGASGNHSLRRGHLYRGDAGEPCPPHRQAAPLRPPGPARLPGRGPGPALKPRRTGPRTQIRGQARQDPGALRRRGPHPARLDRPRQGPRGSGTGLSWPPWSTPSPGSAPWSA